MFLDARGLAWSADGSQLYAVVSGLAAGSYQIRVLTDPTLTVSTLSLSGTSRAILGHSVSLSGTLALSVGQAPAHSRITITRTLAGSAATARFTVSTGTNGSFKLTDTPDKPGRYTYAASYSGSAAIQPSATSRTVTIDRMPTALTVSASKGAVNYRNSVTVTAHLGRTYTGRTVSIYARSFGARSQRLLRRGRVNSRGELSVSYVPSYSTTFSAVFGGDARYAPKTVTHNVYVRARVAESIGGYYRSTRIGGTLYRVYHHTGTLQLAVAVAPDKQGECVTAQVQIYYQGTWYSDLSTGCGYLNRSSEAHGTFTLSKAAGYRYRIEATYVRGSKDTSNLGNHSGWLYFEVVR